MMMKKKKTPYNDKYFANVRCHRGKPTKAHRPALWENMLGGIYAMNMAGECRYFDFKYEEASTFAGITQNGDNRVFKMTEELYKSYVIFGCVDANPRPGKLVLWVPR